MKKRVKEMEEEAAKLREMQAQVEKEMSLAGIDCTPNSSPLMIILGSW